MAIVSKLNKAKRLKNSSRNSAQSLAVDKRIAHRRYRHSAKQAINTEHEINEKPRLTGWDLI